MTVKDVAEAGGWRDMTRLLKSYRHSDEVTLTSVVLDAPKLNGRGDLTPAVTPTAASNRASG
jgi:hypothetical protein